MPVDKQVQLRYEVLNKCFRDLYREYTIAKGVRYGRWCFQANCAE